MATAAQRAQYQRLPGRSGLLMLHRAYLGEDHVLAVRTIIFQERYRRLFFRDIATLSLHRTDRGLWLSLGAGFVALVTALLVWALWPAGGAPVGPGAVFWTIVACGAAIVLLVNLALGPTCTAFVGTAVQIVELPSLNRLPRARRARARIIERANAAQAGEMPPARNEPPSIGVPAPAAPVVAAALAAPIPRGSRTSARRALGLNALGCLAAAAGICFDYLEPARAAVFLSVFGVLIAIVPAVAQLVLSRGGVLPRAAALAGWGALATVMLGMAGGYISFMAALFSDPELVHNGNLQPVLLLAGLPPGANIVVDVCYWIVMSAFVLSGLAAALVWATTAREPAR